MPSKQTDSPSRGQGTNSIKQAVPSRQWGGDGENQEEKQEQAQGGEEEVSGDSCSRLVALSLHMVMADFMEKFGGASGSLLSPLQITAQSEEEGVRPELRVQARAKLDSPPPHTPEHTFGAGCPRVWGVWFFPCLGHSPCSLSPVGRQ